MLSSTVLIVDDDPKMRELLTSILENAAYIVETASNGKDAIKACKKFPVDVALIDVELPDVKGTALLSALKDLRPKMIKIIITGYPSIENAVTAVNEKADGYIVKPFDPAELLEMIRKLIADKKTEYITMLREMEKANQSTPKIRYQNPDGW
ncbi:MAG TPA: response regulator [Candidatus Limnocylindrales bacterium]|nr:response regulator [Candidatus Limnocylindrales bacterium]